jgi:TRAP-type C4-dicarboxylate transport system permease small subunit
VAEYDSGAGWPAALLRGQQKLEKLLALTAFGLLVAVVFADVVSRELTGAGLYWASQVGVWANVLVVMAGFGLASADGAHLRPRFADNWLPQAWIPGLMTAQHGCMALFCVLIAALAARVVAGSWTLGEVSIDLYLPVWPVQLFLPSAFFAAALRHGLYAAFPALRPQDTNAMAMVTSESETRA